MDYNIYRAVEMVPGCMWRPQMWWVVTARGLVVKSSDGVYPKIVICDGDEGDKAVRDDGDAVPPTRLIDRGRARRRQRHICHPVRLHTFIDGAGGGHCASVRWPMDAVRSSLYLCGLEDCLGGGR
ncbi:hypothetical protein E2C01_031709 [Portunus trituberculatus]|uniref:Uncharacterized protein n=1 Tax=Portunus trituberculatus TaxID=210409 RepID=A0A5B7EXL8_PORTR|nr:hypothetical protein [Portunus trituberculatus]